jgi:hypothetical protein
MGCTRQALSRVRLSDVLGLVRDVHTDDAAALRVASHSYWHGNGFCKVVLAHANGLKLRLHVWEAGHDAEENVHDHRWDFASVVIAGTLVSTTFREAPGGDRYDAYRYEGGVAGAYTLNALGSVSLVEAGVSELSAGSSYWLQHDELHQISRLSARELAATLVVTGPAHRGWTRLITNRASVSGEHPPEPLSVGELRRVLRALRHAERSPAQEAVRTAPVLASFI